jgi:TolB-like protein/Flp pilus assembly protein TadD
MDLIAELRRRNVIRMAGLYLVGAWLAVQVAGTVLPMFGAPDWIGRSVVVMLAVGFVPALIFAWVFELTPQGLRRDGDVAAADSIAPHPKGTSSGAHLEGASFGAQIARRMDRMIIVVLLVALAYFSFDKFVLAPRRNTATGSAAGSASGAAHAVAPGAEENPGVVAPAPAKSIAVLPFVNMSHDARYDYLSDGITEEILNALAQVPELKVAARTSAFAFKGKAEDLRKVGETLGVANVLEGSVQNVGDTVRITAQLIDARNGYHLWSEKYDRKLTSVFAIEDEISRAIADRMRAQWSSDEPLVRSGTRDMQAHSLYLQGIAAIAARGTALKQAAASLGQATARDPGYAAAWAQLSQVYELLPWYELAEWDASLDDAERTARRALALDPRSAEGHAALANVLRDRFAFAEAGREYRRALELNPGLSEVHNQYAQLLDAIGELGAAAAQERIAISQDPLAPNPQYMLGLVLDSQRDHDQASAAFERVMRLAPQYAYSRDQLAFSRVYAGDYARALQVAGTVSTGDPREDDRQLVHDLIEAVADPALRAQARPLVARARRIGHVDFGGLACAFWYGLLGAREQALTELEQWAQTAAQGQRFNGLRFLWMPPFDALRDDARFKAVLAKFGLPDLSVDALRAGAAAEERRQSRLPAHGASETSLAGSAK